jgi:hypothetical protein
VGVSERDGSDESPGGSENCDAGSRLGGNANGP